MRIGFPANSSRRSKVRVLITSAAFGAAALAPLPAHAGQAFVPLTIPSDCSRDVTADLNAFFATVRNGNVIKFFINGCYRVDGTLLIQERANLTFDGQGATLQAFTDGTEAADPRTRALWRILWSTNINLKRMTIVGANAGGVYDPDFEAQHGVWLSGVLGATLTDMNVRQVYGDCASVSRGSLGPGFERGSDQVTIRDVNCQAIGRQGISVTWASNVTIIESVLTDIERTVFDLEPVAPEYVIDNILIENNVVNSHGNYALGSGGAGCQVSNVTFRNNTVSVRGNMLVTTNPNLGCRKHGFVIESNTVTMAQGENRFSVWKFVDDVVVSGNDVTIFPSSGGGTRIGAFFQNAGGTLAVTDNAFCNATHAVLASRSAPVTNAGNILVC